MAPPTPRFNSSCVLNEIDLNDPESIARLMLGLHARLESPVAANPDEEGPENDMHENERRNADTIILAIRLNPGHDILLEAVLRFCEGVYGRKPTDMIRAAQELEELGPLHLFEEVDPDNPGYIEAGRILADQQEITRSTEQNFLGASSNGRSNAEPTSQHKDNGQKRRQSEPDSEYPTHTKEAIRVAKKQKRVARSSTTPPTSSSQSGDQPGYLEWAPAPIINTDTSNMTTEEKKLFVNQKHRPVAPKGVRSINDGKADRSQAQLGKPDYSKLVILAAHEVDDDTAPGGYRRVDEDPREYRYTIPVNWDDKTSVQKLNAWRNQVLNRCFGKPYRNERFWTIQERDILTDIVQRHQEAGGVIDWVIIAGEYNSKVKWMSQQRGAMGAERRYLNQYGRESRREAVCISMPLQEDRVIPQRPRWELREEMTFFRSEAAIRTMALIRNNAQKEENYEKPQKQDTKSKAATKGKGKEEQPSEEESQQDIDCAIYTVSSRASTAQASPLMPPWTPARLGAPRSAPPGTRAATAPPAASSSSASSALDRPCIPRTGLLALFDHSSEPLAGLSLSPTAVLSTSTFGVIQAAPIAYDSLYNVVRPSDAEIRTQIEAREAILAKLDAEKKKADAQLLLELSKEQ